MWHPQTEEEAASNVTALLEWLRATGRWAAAEPTLLHDWLAGQPVGSDPELDRYRVLADPTPPVSGRR
jgi:hypothetical protein